MRQFEWSATMMTKTTATAATAKTAHNKKKIEEMDREYCTRNKKQHIAAHTEEILLSRIAQTSTLRRRRHHRRRRAHTTIINGANSTSLTLFSFYFVGFNFSCVFLLVALVVFADCAVVAFSLKQFNVF